MRYLTCLYRVTMLVIIKIKIHSSCEIEYFVETRLCKLCVILRSRVLRVACHISIYYTTKSRDFSGLVDNAVLLY